MPSFLTIDVNHDVVKIDTSLMLAGPCPWQGEDSRRSLHQGRAFVRSVCSATLGCGQEKFPTAHLPIFAGIMKDEMQSTGGEYRKSMFGS